MKKKLIAICTLLFLTIINFSVVAQSFSWSNQIGSNLEDYGRSGTCDSEGNFYYAGIFEGSYCYFQTDTLVRHGINDLFVVKYDPSGNELWVRQIGGWNESTYEGIAVYYDPVSNAIFVAGEFAGTAGFGSCTLTSKGGVDIFLVKYDPAGNCLWGRKVGGIGDDEADRIAFDKTGNIYMCGTNSLPATFDDFIIPGGGFLAKFDPQGICLWAKNKFDWWPVFNSKIRCGGMKIIDSEIIIGGCMALDDTIKIDTIIISHKGFGSSLICCFDSTGTAKWISEGISVATATISDIATDAHGNIFHTGFFSGSINFSGNILTSNPGKLEMFLVKYDKTGKVKWAQQTICIGAYAEGYDLMTNDLGNIFVTGHYNGLTQFGVFQVEATSVENMFVAGYDSLGSCFGVYHFNNGRGVGVIQGMDGNLFLTILFSDSTSLGPKSYTPYGNTDFLLAKCSPITGIGETKSAFQNQLSIYANPTTGKCTVTIPDEFVNEKKLTLQIFDTQGKLVQKVAVEKVDGKIKLNIEAQAKGTYTAILSDGKKSYSGKIIFR
ncbi:MAG: T9SS type A sorting domain-containing protein [Bacteroidales bacterium]